MKKILTLLLMFCAVLAFPALVFAENQRNEQLLDIWKEHVRKLTEERDAAYQELDALKRSPAGTSPARAQFGAIETAPSSMTPSPMAQDVQGLMQQMQRQVDRLNAEKQMLARDKERAQRELETLKSQNAKKPAETDFEMKGLRSPASPAAAKTPASSAAAPLVRQGFDDESKRFLVTRVEDLEKERQMLLVENRNLSSKAKSAENSVGYLESENKKLQANISELRAQIGAAQKATSEKEAALQERSQAEFEAQSLRSRLERYKGLEEATQRMRGQITTLEGQKSKAEDDARRLSEANRALMTENKRMESLAEEAQKASADSEHLRYEKERAEKYAENVKARNAELERQMEGMQSLQREAERALKEKEDIYAYYKNLENDQKSLRERAERLEAENLRLRGLEEKLAANLADLENLKSNFESYLESLVASFQERSGNTVPSADDRSSE